MTGHELLIFMQGLPDEILRETVQISVEMEGITLTAECATIENNRVNLEAV